MKFSVVIPIFNKAKTIQDSINSILAQTYKNFEIIIVDDGSTDNLDEKLCNFKMIKVIRQENSGVSVARNRGIKESTGDYICFLDADDIWYSDHLEVLHNLIKKYSEFNFYVTSHVLTINNNSCHSSHKLRKINKEEFVCYNLFELLNKNSDGILNTNSVCIKKSFIDSHKLYFEPNKKIGEDTDMWYRICLYTPCVITKKETTLYRREFSTATKKTSNTFNWVFAERLNKILGDNNIKPEIKKECILLIDRYKMKCTRDLIFLGNKKEALLFLKDVKNKKNIKFILTTILYILPKFIVKKIYKLS